MAWRAPIACVFLTCCTLLTDLGELGSPDGGSSSDGGGNPDVMISADGAACGSACSNDYATLQTDSCNCGACGHACAGGACQSGHCEPLAIAPARTTTYAATALPYLAIDATNLYWYDNDALVTCPKAGCVQPTPLSPPYAAVGPIVLDSTTVYFGDGTSVFSCAKTGCGMTPTTLLTASSNSTVLGYRVDATNLYAFVDNRTIERCPKTGCGGAPLPLFTSVGVGYPYTQALVAVGNRLVFSAASQQWQYSNFGCTLPDCADAAVIGPADFAELLTDGTTVYAIGPGAQNTTTVVGCPVAGCTTLGTPAPSLTAVDAFTVDDTDLFAIDGALPGANVVHCPKGSCTAVTTIGTATTASEMVVDDTFLYWIDGTSVVRVPRQ
jgi:hypothetical protein